MIKFDCTKVSGKIDSVKVTGRMTKGYKTLITLNGSKLPNIQMEPEFFEELNPGEEVTLYTICKNSNKKEKNMGVLYGYKKEGEQSKFATKYRWTVPSMMIFFAALAFCLVFIVGWPVSAALLALTGMGNQTGMSQITHYAFVEACLAAGFYLWAAWKMLSVTADPEGWQMIDPQALSSRFSKLDK